jgi:Rrf2 family nitric oxide-sensitive transcriptional repressor
MRLTAFTDHSLRVLIFLATEPGRRATIAEIATAFDAKENHLTKVVHFLGKAGLLANVRGKGGGLQLARAPAEIVIGNVVRLTEGVDLPAGCFDRAHDRCRIVSACQLRGVLHEAVAAFYRVLDGYTLADITVDRPALARILFTEGQAAAPGKR